MIDAYEFIEKVYKTKRDPLSRDYDRVIHYLQKLFTFKEHKFKSGDNYGGWKIPDRWELHSASLSDGRGNKVLSHKETPLRVMRYSQPISGFISYNELKKHIRVDGNISDAIPYETNVYGVPNWALCMSLKEFSNLNESDKFYVNIDSEFKGGEMTVLEYYHKGQTDIEIIFNAHLDGVCQADYGLSGVAMILHLIEHIQNRNTRYSYRFIIGPQTIGPTAMLSKNPEMVRSSVAGIDLDFMGNCQMLRVQQSLDEDLEINSVAMELKRNNIVIEELDNFGDGNLNLGRYIASDTLVYNSFGVPMISMYRLPYRYAHTNFDSLNQISEISLEESFEKLLELIEIFETNKIMYPIKSGLIFLDPEDFPKNLIPVDFDLYKFSAIYSHETILNAAQEMKILYPYLLEIVRMLEDKGLIETKWEDDLQPITGGRYEDSIHRG